MPLVPALARLSLAEPCVARTVADGVRALSTSASVAAPPRNNPGGSRARREKKPARPLRTYPVFDEWVESADAERYRFPSGPGPHWLGRTPFPLNPAFNPPPPVAVRTRAEMWEKHRKDPATYSIRALAYMYNLPLDRTTAILRLKALEQEMRYEGHALQTDFEKGMEYLLGAKEIRVQHQLEKVFNKEIPGPVDLPAEPLQESTGAPEIKPPLYENHPDDGSLESVLGPAMRRATKHSREQRAELPSWGPELETEANERTFRSVHPNRYPINYKDFGGNSYLAAGESIRAMRHQVKKMHFKSERARNIALYTAEPVYDEQGNEIVPVTSADGIPRAGDRGWTVAQRKMEKAKLARKEQLVIRVTRARKRKQVQLRHRAKWAALRLAGRLNRHFRWRFGDHIAKQGVDLKDVLPDHLDKMLILKALDGAEEVREEARKELEKARPILEATIKELEKKREARRLAAPQSKPKEEAQSA